MPAQTSFDIIADLDTPVSAYLKMAPFRPRFLLESVEGGERIGRYSFIGFGESFDLRLPPLQRSTTTASSTADVDAARADLLLTLRAALAQAPRPGPEIPGLPFRGGLVGVSGYDLVRRLERLGPGPTPEAVGSIGARLDEGRYVAPQSLLVFDHLTRSAALLHDGPDADRTLLRREVVAALRGSTPARARPGSYALPAASLDRPDFLARVQTAQEHIAAGDLYQLVLSIRFSGECDLAPFEVYRALRLLNPSPYLYFLDFGDMAVVGSSPEALVRLEGRRASLRPIAGTRPRGRDEATDRRLEQELLDDPKEASEHVMLVDLARNDLGRVAVPGSIQVAPFRSVERYSHVMHLVSGVEGVLSPEVDAFDLFAAAFPAGTVVGAPKIRAMEILDALEPTPRGVYAGTAGYFGHGGGMDQAIAIRTLVFREGAYAFQAGAGIVADSVPAREHDEVVAKGAALGAALALAQEGL